jgi:hypothetical protein
MAETTVASTARRCPACGELHALPLVYGLPDESMFEASERGEVELGGCIVGDGDPDMRCVACGHAWRTHPMRQRL